MTGFPDAPPVMMGSYVCDFSAGLYGVIGTLAALHSREQTGKGQVVDVSLLDCACSLTHSAIMNYFMLNEVTTRNGNQDRAAWPASFYPTKDHKLIYIHAGQDPAFAAFCHISGNESYAEDPEYMHLNGRKNHIRVCDQLVSEWTCNHTLNEIMSMCRENNIPCAPVNTVKEMVSDPQLLHRNMICDMYDNNLGTIKTTGPVLKMSETQNGTRSKTSTVWQIVGRLVAAAIVLAITAFFTPGFTINNIWSLIIAAVVLSVIDYLLVKFTGLHASPFGKGFVGFALAAITLYVTQFFVAGYSISWIAAIIGALIYGVVDYFLPGNQEM